MTSTLRCMIAAMTLFGLAACETVQGAGKDIQSAGKAITDTAEDAES
ncbi:entericidin A/B family lipoprotein [Pseudohalocynthiibacter aestuariivivens]|uniref:Entericidin A/B family lipoprotein n=1 Tax=Roseovarius pelagicus TaxID=2980108 RepID=A0ABY6DE45_9RHOB|nr:MULTISPECIES: entericidin A/B family lipoprotein [Rhodobacterales]QIE47325.1 entericidin A/B family lipoprotein [Pseudohalocynthiibacter aestuariivivens]UXX84114.1 entericidin A/B family lipoprotein [Roseovarius pelagicus]